MKTSATSEESQAMNFQNNTHSLSSQESDIVPSYKTYPNPFLFKRLEVTSQFCAISTLLLKREASLKEVSCYFYSGLAKQLTPTHGSL